MSLRVHSAVTAMAVEGVFRFFEDSCAGFLCSFKMRVDIFIKKIRRDCHAFIPFVVVSREYKGEPGCRSCKNLTSGSSPSPFGRRWPARSASPEGRSIKEGPD